MAERKPRIVWEDHDHAYVWSTAFDNLRERGYEVKVFGYLVPELDREREKLLKNADVLVIHSGTIRPPDLSEMIKDLKDKFNVRVLLQTEAVNELTEPHIDGVISVYYMNDLDELERVLLDK